MRRTRTLLLTLFTRLSARLIQAARKLEFTRFNTPRPGTGERCKRVILGAALLILAAINCFAQDRLCPPLPNTEVAEAAFSSAALLGSERLKNLMQTRDVPYTGNSKNPDLVELMNRLSVHPRLGLLLFSYSDPTLSSWLITRCGIEAYATTQLTRSALDEVVKQLRTALSISSRQAARPPSRRQVTLVDNPGRRLSEEASRRMSELILPSNFHKPISSLAYLEIIPTEGLGMIPFALLRPFGTDEYLVDRLAFSVAASLGDVARYLAKEPIYLLGVHNVDNTRVRATAGLENPIVVGNPSFPKDLGVNLPPLPGAEREAIRVASILNTKPLLGKAATKEAILAATKNSQFIYLATHGAADPKDAVHKSFVALAGPNYRWTAEEIQNSKFPNALVVLSACQTGLGQVHDAGIIGIARAFQIAGADVVVSLWNVDDAATVDLMTAFVENAKRESQSDALRDAMLAARRVHPEPALWAPFMIFGNVW